METSNRACVLVVDDADSIRKEICLRLKQEGYEVRDAWSLAGAMRYIEMSQLDLAIVDLELDDGDGLTIIKALSEKAVPSMVVSVRSDPDDRVDSLELGARDYMTKPIDFRELLIRVRNLLASRANVSQKAKAILEFGPFRLDLIGRTLTVGEGRPQALSRTELIALQYFMESPKKVIERGALARRLSKVDNPNSRALDMLVSKLRSKIDVTGRAGYIRSVRGVGYLFDASVLDEQH